MLRKTAHSRAARLAALSAAALLCTIGGVIAPTGAWAADTAGPETSGAALENVAAEDASLLLSPATGPGTGITQVGEGTAAVPATADVPVSLTGEDGAQLDIHLPTESSPEAAPAAVLGGGTVVYPGADFSNSVIVGDAGVQMLTTIAGQDSPTAYEYRVSLEEGQALESTEGGAAILNADGTIAVAIGKAWAKDAKGVDVPTHYEVHGSTLTQIVDHADGNFTYPVLADPIWLAPWVVRCLIGIGINGATITRIASSGSLGAVLAAFGYGAFRCILGR